MKLNEMLKMFPVTDAVKMLQVGNRGTEKEFYIDNRTEADTNFNYTVYPLTDNSFCWAYVCPNCQQVHFRSKRSVYRFEEDYTYTESFTIPEDEVDPGELHNCKDEETGIMPCTIHIVDPDGMTVFRPVIASMLEELRLTAIKSGCDIKDIACGFIR